MTKDPDSRFQEYEDTQNHILLGVATGFAKIDEATAGLQPGQLVTIIAPPKTGKASPYDTPVLTPLGWSTMGDLNIGDYVIGSDGKPTKVLAIHEQGVVPVYRVTANDGGSVETCEEHLWEVRPHGQKPTVVSTLEIKNRLIRNKRFAYLPVVGVVDYPEADLPLHPWVIGAMIGDGSYGNSQSAQFTNIDSGVLMAISELSPSEVSVSAGSYAQYSFVTPRGKGNALLDGLVSLGLRGQTRMDKRLPEGYLTWSYAQRRDLLAGLLDTDGSFEKGNSVTFSTVVPDIASAVQQLVWSLGGTCTKTLKTNRHYVFKGKKTPAKDAYNLVMRLPYGNPFGYSVKREKFSAKKSVTRPVVRRIESVNYSRDALARCITVEAPNHLYVTEDYLVTHNSQIALQVAINVHESGKVPMFQSFEMTNHEQAQRHDAMRAHLNHKQLRLGKLSSVEEDRYGQMLDKLKTSHPFHLVDAVGGMTIDSLVAKAEQLKPDIIFVDGVYLMFDQVTGEANTPQALTNITRGLKRVAQSMKIPVVITTQTLLWKMKGGKVTADSIGYSSSFFQDSDVILGLEPVENDDKIRLLKVVQSRNCPPESTSITWSWDTGCFHDELKQKDCKFCLPYTLTPMTGGD